MGFRGSEDSAQIIVVAALLLAVLFVGLALVLNSAIYAENMATRGETSTSDAMATDGVTAERLGNAIDAANYGTEEATYAERRSRISDNASEWDRLMAARQARDGRRYTTEPTAMTDGTRVNQSTRGDFMPADSSLLDEVTVVLVGDFRIDPLGLGDKKNWIVANDTAVRDFEMTVERESLYEKQPDTSTKVIEVGNSVITGSRLFWVEVDQNDASDEFTRVYLLNDTDNASVEAVVVEFDDGGPGTVRGRCRAPGSDVTVRLTAGELIGDDGVVECPALAAASSGYSREIYYAGADEVTGTYQFLADKPQTEFRAELEDRYGLLLEGVVDALADALLALLGGNLDDDDIYHDSPGDGDPYTTTAIYDATLETTYSDGRITYTRNVTYPPAAR